MKEPQLRNLTIDERIRLDLPADAEVVVSLRNMIEQLEKRLDDFDSAMADAYADGRKDAAREIRDLLEKFDE